jgi:hypothetical protein
MYLLVSMAAVHGQVPCCNKINAEHAEGIFRLPLNRRRYTSAGAPERFPSGDSAFSFSTAQTGQTIMLKQFILCALLLAPIGVQAQGTERNLDRQ